MRTIYLGLLSFLLCIRIYTQTRVTCAEGEEEEDKWRIRRRRRKNVNSIPFYVIESHIKWIEIFTKETNSQMSIWNARERERERKIQYNCTGWLASTSIDHFQAVAEKKPKKKTTSTTTEREKKNKNYGSRCLSLLPRKYTVEYTYFSHRCINKMRTNGMEWNGTEPKHQPITNDNGQRKKKNKKTKRQPKCI